MNSFAPLRGLVATVVLALCALAAIPARAETDAEKKQQAKAHYELATRFYDVGKYGEAINEYEAAYLLTGDPALLYNIGQAYRLWDRPDDAIRVYKNYLRQRPDAVNRADVERKIADLEKTVEERHRSGAVPPEAGGGPPGQYAGHSRFAADACWTGALSDTRDGGSIDSQLAIEVTAAGGRRAHVCVAGTSQKNRCNSEKVRNE